MGYTTEFTGSFKLSKRLTKAQSTYLKAFNQTRHMIRDAAVVERHEPKVREAAGVTIGQNGEHYAQLDGEGDWTGVLKDECPIGSKISYYCQWIPTDDGKGIAWDGGEKFYHYVEWLQYLIDHFLTSWGVVLSGSVAFQGEDSTDKGWVVVRGGQVESTKMNPDHETITCCIPKSLARYIAETYPEGFE